MNSNDEVDKLVEERTTNLENIGAALLDEGSLMEIKIQIARTGELLMFDIHAKGHRR